MQQRSSQAAPSSQPNPMPFHTYRLKFVDDGCGVRKDVEFEAHDAAMALIVAHQEASNRSAELWCDGRRLCTIRRTELDVWEISALV